jgi:hypothetical protein
MWGEVRKCIDSTLKFKLPPSAPEQRNHDDSPGESSLSSRAAALNMG